jgi:hypothetical protein
VLCSIAIQKFAQKQYKERLMKRNRYTFAAVVLCVLCITTQTFSQTETAPSGSGTSGDPYLVATLDNLYWITQNSSSWSSYFKQTANIDASSSSGWSSGAGFSPIGNGSNSFTGTYDGSGYTISSLFISRSTTDYIGLFGLISDATIKNVNLTNENITGQSNVGGLVGSSTGSGSALIENCSTTGSVTGTGSQEVGGLVGGDQSGTTINTSYSSANVNGSNYVGGFTGQNSSTSTISNCYSTGSVNGQDYVGGFAGVNDNFSPGAAHINNSYSMGSVSGLYTHVGGLVGGNLGTVSNSFWNTDSSGSTGIGGGTTSGATGETTDNMKTQSTFTDAGWDFTNIWTIDGTNNDGYPYLQNVTPLPVELTSFTAALLNSNNAELSWSTATEVQSIGFEIDRKAIASEQLTVTCPLNCQSKVSNAQWMKVGFVEGSGTTNAPKNYSFTDIKISAGRYAYRLKQIDRDGTFKYSQEVEIAVEMPRVFSLEQNYPNPFNPTTRIQYSIASSQKVTLKVYNILGEEVATLVNEVKDAGTYDATFDGSRLASGIYFYTLKAGNYSAAKKLLLMK